MYSPFKDNMYKLDFWKQWFEASFNTKVVRKYWFKCHKSDFCHKRWVWKYKDRIRISVFRARLVIFIKTRIYTSTVHHGSDIIMYDCLPVTPTLYRRLLFIIGQVLYGKVIWFYLEIIIVWLFAFHVTTYKWDQQMQQTEHQ